MRSEAPEDAEVAAPGEIEPRPWTVRFVPDELQAEVARRARKAKVRFGAWLADAIRMKMAYDDGAPHRQVALYVPPPPAEDVAKAIELFAKMRQTGIEPPPHLAKQLWSLVAGQTRHLRRRPHSATAAAE